MSDTASTVDAGPISSSNPIYKARKRRNLWIALTIGAFVLLVFFISMAKVQDGIVAYVRGGGTGPGALCPHDFRLPVVARVRGFWFVRGWVSGGGRCRVGG